MRLCMKKSEQAEKLFIETLNRIKDNADIDRDRTDSHLKATFNLFKGKLENHNNVMNTFNNTFIEFLATSRQETKAIERIEPILERLERKI